MARDLDQVKEELYEAFNKAMTGVREFGIYSGYPDRLASTAKAATAAADVANAIVNVERELEERSSGGMGSKLRVKP
jgi:hypothetical protein